MQDKYKALIAGVIIVGGLSSVVYTTVIKPKQQIKAIGAVEFSSNEAINKEISQIEALIEQEKYQQALQVIESRKELMSENDKLDPRLSDLEKKLREYIK